MFGTNPDGTIDSSIMGNQGAIETGDVHGALVELDARVTKLEGGGFANKKAKADDDDDGGGDVPLTPEQRLSEVEDKFRAYGDQLASLDTIFSEQLQKLQAQVTDLEKEIGEIVDRIQSGYAGGRGGGTENFADISSKLAAMQEELESITALAAKLIEDKDERQITIDVMQEQIELLKTIKADREDLEDALADKADACAVNRKVSHDQFDAACDDLARGIEDALSKLTQQEQLWQQALDDIQREIGNKLDKMELAPLKDFVHNKLKILQERLKALAALKRETEAAGTKSKFLRNVQCISCDKDVVMRKEMDSSLLPPKPGLPPTKSMAPYLAYELDALRKQQKCMPHSRNMNHFENVMTGAKSSPADDHLCNRYCGGSHTVTTPQQRVTRLGHFLQQWGPDSQPAIESQIRGTDGQMYKAREEGGTPQVKPTHPEIEEAPGSAKRVSLTVQGDIVSARTSIAKPSEPPIAEAKEPDQQSVQPSAAPAHEPSVKRASITSQGKGGSARRSITSAKRDSAGSAGKVSQARDSKGSLPKAGSKQASQASVRQAEPEAAAEAEGGADAAVPEASAEPVEAEAAPPAPTEEEAEAAPESAPEE